MPRRYQTILLFRFLILALVAPLLGSSSFAQISISGDVRPNSVVNPTWNFGDSLLIGYFGGREGAVRIEAGGRVAGVETRLGQTSAGRVGTGNVTITGSGAQLFNSQNLVIANSGVGTMLIEKGGEALNSTGVIGLSAGATGVVDVTGIGSVWNNVNGLYVGGTTSAGGLGTLNITNGGLVSTNLTTKVWGTGKIKLDGGTLRANTLDISSTGAQFDFCDGTLDVNNLIGNISQQAGVLAMDSLDGNLIQYGGTIAPGNSPGTTSIAGNYELNGGVMAIELAGTAQGSQYDFIDVAGFALIDPTDTKLNVSLLGGFENTILSSDSFTFLNADGGITGTFNGLTDGSVVQTTDGLGSFEVNYVNNSVVLSNFVRSVPEPGSVCLLSLLAMGLLAARKRK